MDENTQSTKIIVEGEASESDEDENVEVEQSKVCDYKPHTDQNVKETDLVVSNPKTDQDSVVSSPPTDQGVVVSGEASESEEEFEIVTKDGKITPLSVNTSEKGDNNDVSSPTSPSYPIPSRDTKPKYNTLLNRKLKERNLALRRHIVDTIHQSYQIAAKDLHNLTSQLQKSHIAIQDVSHHMRNTTNDLFHLEDKVDIVCSCFILPEINIPVKPDVNIPVNPDVNIPVNPDVNIPVQPDVNIPVNPDVNIPVNPDVNIPVQPDVSVPVNPDVSFPPETVTTEQN